MKLFLGQAKKKTEHGGVADEVEGFNGYAIEDLRWWWL